MKSNLAQKSEMNNEISVHPSTLKKLERQAMSEKFSLGYVQSSQLYRKEVYPFLSDAARHVYFELESKINGFQKESDFVSYSQLQGNTDIEGARVVARASIAKGLKELIKHGVISVLGTSKKGNKYQINEVSLLGKQYTKKTSSPTELVHVVDQSSLPSRPQLVHVVDTQKKDLKKYIKNTHTQGNALQNDDAWKPENSFLKTLLCQTKFGHQTDAILGMIDFEFHLGNFNAHWENKTYLTENQKHRKFAMWLVQEFEKAERSVKAKTHTSEKPSRNVNDAWDSIPQFQGEVAPVEIPEDFV